MDNEKLLAIRAHLTKDNPVGWEKAVLFYGHRKTGLYWAIERKAGRIRACVFSDNSDIGQLMLTSFDEDYIKENYDMMEPIEVEEEP